MFESLLEIIQNAYEEKMTKDGLERGRQSKILLVLLEEKCDYISLRNALAS